VNVEVDGSFKTDANAPLNKLHVTLNDFTGKQERHEEWLTPPFPTPYVIRLRRNNEYKELPKLKVVPEGQPLKRGGCNVALYSETRGCIVGTRNYDPKGSDTFDVDPDVYRVLLFPEWNNDVFWGEGTVTVPSAGEQELRVRMRPAARIDLTFKDAATNAIPEFDRLKITVEMQIGTQFHELKTYPFWKRNPVNEGAFRTGCFSLQAPSGTLRIWINREGGDWIPQSIPLTVQDGETVRRDCLLSRNVR
jgi:hypothetical protein